MKKSLLLNCGFVFLLSASLYASENNKDEWQKNSDGSHYSYEQSEFTTFQYNATEGALNGYTLSPGGAPDGYSYVAEKTVASAGGLNVNDETKEKTDTGDVKELELNGAASATAWIAANVSPVSFAISMSGELKKSGGEGGIVTWNASAGTKFYWIEASGHDEKDITVPKGTTIQYVAKENGSSKRSNWTVSLSGGSSQSKSDAASITFNRSSWGDIAAWFTSDQTVTTPVPGVYTITAVPSDNTSFAPAPSATMTVVGGEFTEDSNHTYGFDDYTNWSKNATDYYDLRTGNCSLPYASIKSGGNGKVQFNPTPGTIDKDIEFSSSTSRMTYSPDKTKENCDVSFSATSGWFSSAATLSAELDDATLAELNIVSFEQTSKKMLVVLVLPNLSTTVNAPSGASSTNLNKVYRQVVLSISCDTEAFIYSGSPSVWTESDRSALCTSFIASPPAGIAISDYDHILFVIPGSDSSNALAWGQVGGKYMWIYTSTSGSYIVAHELGHNYGLDDIYTRDSNGYVTMGDDLHNLMNAYCSAIHSNQFRLRESQWTTIR